MDSSSNARSRSRGRDDRGEDDTEIEEDDEEESTSLLQISSRKKSQRAGMQVEKCSGGSIDGVADLKEKAHVFDRWCSEYSETVTPSATNPRHPQVLQLDALLSKDATYAQVNFHRSSALMQRLRTLWLPPFDLDSGIVWHEATLQAWHWTTPWDGRPPADVHFYVDGSSVFNPDTGMRQAGAATALLLTTSYRIWWGGLQARKVEGAATSPHAEAAALLQAILWAHSLLNQFPALAEARFHFWGDSIGPGHFASGDWLPKAHLKEVNASRELFYWLEERVWQSCSWHHVKAHSGCPWNECVDVAANAAAQGGPSFPSFSDLWSEVINDDADQKALGWVWYIERLQWCPSEEVHVSQRGMTIKLPAKHIEGLDTRLAMKDCWQTTHDVPSPFRKRVEFTVATANVLSLFAGKDDKLAKGQYVSARMEALQLQFDEAGIDAIGVQETRHKAQRYFHCDGYHVLSGAATSKGHGGVQLWVAKQLQCGLCIKKEHLTMLHQDPQQLIVQLRHPDVKMIFLVAHAPTLDKTDELQQWWQQVDVLLRQCPKWPVISLIDANSRVGCPTSHSVGDCGAQPENAAGAWFHEWLIRNEFWAPSTFAECHSGDHDTWFHANGASARLDYVALSHDFRDSAVRTWIPQDVDLSMNRTDHLPVCCRFDMWVQEGTPLRRTPKNEGFPNQQEETSLRLPSQPWSLNVHEHANCIEERLRSFRSPRTFKDQLRKKHLTEATWTMIKAKRACWRNVLLLRSHLRLGILRELWNAWRRSTPREDCGDEGSSVTFQPWLRWNHFEAARWSYLHGRFSTKTAQAVREDDQIYYDALAKRAGEVDSQHGIKQLWREVAAALPKAQTRKKNNTIAQQPPFAAMQKHFDQLEAGDPISFKGLVDSCQLLQRGASRDNVVEFDLCDIFSD